MYSSPSTPDPDPVKRGLRSTIGDDNAPEIVDNRHQLEATIQRIRDGDLTPNDDTFDGWEYPPATAHEIIRATKGQGHQQIVLSGRVAGDLTLSQVNEMVVAGEIAGTLVVGDDVGHLVVAGKAQHVVVSNVGLKGNLIVAGEVTGNLAVAGEVAGDLVVADRQHLIGRIGGNLIVVITGRISGKLVLAGELAGNLQIDGEVSGDLEVLGAVGGNLEVLSTVGGAVKLDGTVSKNLFISGTTQQVFVRGKVGGDLNMAGHSPRLDFGGNVVGDLDIWAGVVNRVVLGGKVGGRTVLTPNDDCVLESVRRGRFGDEVFVGNNVDISGCDFRQCPDLNRFLFVGEDPFPLGKRELARPIGERGEEVSAVEMASIYRQLRTNLESRQNRAAAGTFYRGEMEARREASTRWTSAEWWILSLYKWTSGYGLAAWRAVVAFFVLVLVGAVLYSTSHPFNPITETNLVDGTMSRPGLGFWRTLLFSLESMVGLFRPPGDHLDWGERLLQILQRVAGPVLIAQATLAIRERVAR